LFLLIITRTGKIQVVAALSPGGNAHYPLISRLVEPQRLSRPARKQPSRQSTPPPRFFSP